MGTNLRPDALSSTTLERAVPRNDALRLLYKSVARRRTLIKGKLKKDGRFCAIGCLADDCAHDKVRRLCVLDTFVDEVAAVNDKLPDSVSPHRRWKYVMKWLRAEIAKLDSASKIKGDQT